MATTDYGHDLSCTLRSVSLPFPDGTTRIVTAVQPTLDMADVTGRPCLAEALVRRLTTPRGTLIDVVVPSTTENYGDDISQWLNDDIDARRLAQAGAAVDAECRKDERVEQSQTAPTLAGDVLVLPVNITDGAGPFRLVLAVSQVSVSVLSAP